MKTASIAVVALLVFAMLALPVTAEETLPLIPQDFYGTVTDADGSAAPAGTIIVASSKGVPLGTIKTTVPGEYGGSGTEQRLIVQGTTLVSNAPIAFYIDGVKARETASFQSGCLTRLNLSASSALPKERPGESTTEPLSPKAGQNTTVTGNGTGTSVTLTTTVDLADETIAFTAFDTPPDNQAVPSTLAPVGRYAEITSTIANNQIASVTIRITYTDAEIAAAGIDEAGIRVYWWNPATALWEQLPGGVDTVQNYAWGTTSHFSTFALLSVKAVTPTPGGGGGGGGGGAAAGPSVYPSDTFGTPTVTPTGTATPPTVAPTAAAPGETAVPGGEAGHEGGEPGASGGQAPEELPMAIIAIAVLAIAGVAAAFFFLKKQ
ncbi:hypothetical protein [Methanoculleus taiwanensis]|uniref:hypothetical protein n=1 Tax=Methanoculleus taiwanensis TaxID=1550565 RepID=UPI000FFEFE47|nr:hypothetical protein [Methanoculleus taiwanensis]